MVRFLLDSDTCIHLLNRRREDVHQRYRALDASAVGISAVTVGELRYGAWKSARVADNIRLLEDFVTPLAVIPFDDVCTDAYGRVRAHLARAGTPIGANDTLIAATAIVHDLTLVTANIREFARVPGLRLEDWTAAETGPPNPVQP